MQINGINLSISMTQKDLLRAGFEPSQGSPSRLSLTHEGRELTYSLCGKNYVFHRTRPFEEPFDFELKN